MANTGKVISTKITLEGADEIKRAFEALGRAGETAFAKIRAAADKAAPGLGGKLDASVTKLQAGLAGLRAAGQNMAPAFNSLKINALSAGAAFTATATKVGLLATAVTGATAALAKFAKSGVDAVDLAARQSDAVGTNIKDFTRLAGAAKQTDVSAEELVKGLNRINVALGKTSDEAGETGDGVSKTTEAFARLGLSVQQLQGLSAEGKFRALADGFARIASAPERAAIATQIFGRGLSTTLLPLLVKGGDALKAAADDAEAFGATFDDVDKKISDLADSSLDRLGLALQGLSARTSLAFAPMLTEAANGISSLVKENLPLVKQFAEYLGKQAVQLVKDFFNAVNGNDSAVVNKTFLGIRDAAIAVGTGFKFAVDGVIIPALKALESAASVIAGALNGIFGTEFTGKTLLATAVVLKLTGVFRLLRTSIATVIASGRLLLLFFTNFRGIAVATGAALSGLAATVARLAVAVGALVLANPLVAALAVSLAAVAGGVIYLATRQTEAEKAASAHADAMERLKAVQGEVDAGIDGSIAKLEEWKNAQLAAGAAAIVNAEAQLTLAQQNLDNIVFQTGQIGEEWLQNNVQIKAAADAVRKQSDNLKQVKLNLAEQMVAYEDTKARADALAASQKVVADEASRAVGETAKLADGFKRIVVRGPDGFEKAFDVPTEKLIQAQLEAKKLGEALQSTGDTGLLDDATAKADAFATSIQALSEQIQIALIDMSAAASEQVAALVSALPQFFESLPGTIAAVFSSIGTALQSVWGNAMNIIINQTRNMVNAVQSLINSLVNTLTALLNKIAQAKASASSDSGGGGGGSGGAGGFASGGYIRGSGTSTSDSIPAWLSNGEFVIRASAVRRYGADLFAALNGMRLAPNAIGRYAMGGLVGLTAMPAMSSGPTSNLTLVLDNQQFSGLTGPADTLDRLERAIKARRIRATGRQSPYER